MIIQSILDLVALLYHKGVQDVVICPGSRSAPISIAFYRFAKFNIKIIFDERSAGYIGLGISLFTQKPTVLVCTSGTAALNFYPSICEAYYQKIPLIVITADRPSEWIDQGDGQTIRQNNVFINHVKKSYNLPYDLSHPDSKWFFNRLCNEAIEYCKTPPLGPVHLNIPVREPFYPEKDEKFTFNLPQIIKKASVQSNCTVEQVKMLASQLHDKKVILFVGQANFEEKIHQLVDSFCKKHKIVLIADRISNIPAAINLHELILLQPDCQTFKPDIVLTLGEAVLSKTFKQFVRKNKNAIQHWHIGQNEIFAPDVFQCLQFCFDIDVASFFKQLSSESFFGSSEYFNLWNEKNKKITHHVIQRLENLPYGEFLATYLICKNIKNNETLHVANSMPIRYVNIIPNTFFKIFCNRGTSGIDGSNSTAVGYAMQDNRQNYLLTGDMSFLYDKNAFWHPYEINNLKIIVLNNYGGGIFRIIDGPSQLPELEELFVTQQKFKTKMIAEHYEFQYLSSSNMTELVSTLKFFFDAPQKTVLEIFTNGSNDAQIFNDFYTFFKRITI